MPSSALCGVATICYLDRGLTSPCPLPGSILHCSWPFGRELRRRPLPTTLADLYLSRMPATPIHQDGVEALV